MDKNISEAHIYNAYICMYDGTNFLRDTKCNNYKQHRLSDNNHNCKFLCDTFFWELFQVNIWTDSQGNFFFFNKAPQIFFFFFRKISNTHAKCIVNSWIKGIFFILQPLRLPSNGLSSNEGVDASLAVEKSFQLWKTCLNPPPPLAALVFAWAMSGQPWWLHHVAVLLQLVLVLLLLGQDKLCGGRDICSDRWRWGGGGGHFRGQVGKVVEVGGRRRALLLLQGLSWKGCWG